MNQQLRVITQYIVSSIHGVDKEIKEQSIEADTETDFIEKHFILDGIPQSSTLSSLMLSTCLKIPLTKDFVSVA